MTERGFSWSNWFGDFVQEVFVEIPLRETERFRMPGIPRDIEDVVAGGDLVKADELYGQPIVIVGFRLTNTQYGEAARVSFYFENDADQEIRAALYSSEAIKDQMAQIAMVDAFPVRATLAQRYSDSRKANYNVFENSTEGTPAPAQPPPAQTAAPGPAAVQEPTVAAPQDDDIPF